MRPSPGWTRVVRFLLHVFARRFIGVFLFPILMGRNGLPGAELAAAVVSALGIVVTVLMLPGTHGKTLEELNEAAQAQDRCDSPAERLFSHQKQQVGPTV